MTTLDKIQYTLLYKEPFFAQLLLNLKVVPITSEVTVVDTPMGKQKVTDVRAATDGEHIFWNFEYWKDVPEKEQLAVILHELLHVAFMHGTRKQGRDHKKWNYACDYAINLMIKNWGYTLPSDCLLDDKYSQDGKVLSEEKIYDMLPEKIGGWGIGEDILTMPEEVMRKVVEAATAAKMAGKVPGGMEEYLDGLTRPKVNWRSELKRFVSTVAKNDYSFRRPNTRYKDVYLPSLYSEEIGGVVFIVDTSGSMMGEDIRLVFSELTGILKLIDKIKVISVDCDVQSVEDVTTIEGMKVRGGGGTSFAPGFKYIIDNSVECKAVVYLTDGYADEFGPDPGLPVLWLVTDRKDFKPPFGWVIPYSRYD